MLILIVLLACLVSILMITLLKVTAINTQVVLFLLVLIAMILFKLILDSMIKTNTQNPLSKNMISNINLDTQTPKDSQVLPHNFNTNTNANLNNIVPSNAKLNSIIPTTNNQVKLNNATVHNHTLKKLNMALNNIEKNNLLQEDTNIESVNNNVTRLGNNVANNVGNNVANNVGNNVGNNGQTHSCLLNDYPCKQIAQKTCCGSVDTNRTPCGNCPASQLANGEKVNSECLKNNTVNYADVFNANANANAKSLDGDCAFDNSCVTNPDNANMHLGPPRLNPGDPDFTNETNFWKFSVNNSDMCYIQRSMPGKV
jgi:hypothetical protein